MVALITSAAIAGFNLLMVRVRVRVRVRVKVRVRVILQPQLKSPGW